MPTRLFSRMSATLVTFVCLLVLVTKAHAQHPTNHAEGWFAGEGTQYTLTEPSNGNCNFMAFPTRASTKYAAINAPQFKRTANCGRCAEVTCVDELCGGATQRTETVHIVDQCPECVKGDLDLSPDVFKTITGLESNRVQIQWKFVDCPVEGTIRYCLKSGSNPFWTAIQPTNFIAGVESLLVNGKPTTMVDSAYYFLLDGKSADQTDLGALALTLTSVNGEVIQETVSLKDGGCVDSKFQFAKGAPTSARDFDEEPPSSEDEAGVVVETVSPSPSSSSSPSPSPSPEPTTPTPSLLSKSDAGSRTAAVAEAGIIPATTSLRGSVTESETVAPTSTPATSTGIVRITTRADGDSHSTSIAIIVLLVLAAAGIVVLIVLAIVVKRRRREDKRLSELEREITHVSHLPPLIVKQRSYEEISTPSQRADIAVL